MSSLGRSPAGRRSTKQRTLLRELVEGSEAFLTAQEIHQLLRSRGESVGLATVYRNLQVLASEDVVDTLRDEEGETRYRACSPRHHHHLVCRDCGRVIEIEGPAVERWAAAAADGHGFTDVAHTVEIFGQCPDCGSHHR